MSGSDPLNSDPQQGDLLKYRQMQKKFRHACRQVVLLNNRISDVQLRYDRAVKANKRSWRYVTRLNLASIEGVRNMFYEYACRRADELDQMQDRLINAGVILENWSMEDDSEEDGEADTSRMEEGEEEDNFSAQGDSSDSNETNVQANSMEQSQEDSQGEDEAPDIGARQ